MGRLYDIQTALKTFIAESFKIMSRSLFIVLNDSANLLKW